MAQWCKHHVPSCVAQQQITYRRPRRYFHLAVLFHRSTYDLLGNGTSNYHLPRNKGYIMRRKST